MVRQCPTCGLVNPPEAQRCDCGYDFSAVRQERSYLPGRAPKHSEVGSDTLLSLGCVGMVVGVVAGVIVGVTLRMWACARVVEQIKALEPDRHVDGLIALPYIAEGVIFGTMIGGLVGLVAAVLLGRRYGRR